MVFSMHQDMKIFDSTGVENVHSKEQGSAPIGLMIVS